MEDQIFTPQETPTLDDVMNTEQEDVVYTPLDNVIDDEIHTQTEPSDVEIPVSEEIETGEPIEVTIDDQIITPKKNRIDFQGYELDNISEADNENDVPSIKQVRDIVEEVESEKQDKLTAGDNITITDNVISATDTTYTAGDNISISDENVISATDTTYTAGDNITITGNVISATDTTYTAGSGLTLTDTEFSVGTITNSMIDDNAINTGKIANKAVTNAKLDDEVLHYKAGDVIQVGEPVTTALGNSSVVVSVAYITSGAKQVAFNIPIKKDATGLTATITDGQFWIRYPAGGYMINGDNPTSYSLKTHYLGDANIIGVNLEKTDGTAFNVTNNTVLVVGGWFKITFS